MVRELASMGFPEDVARYAVSQCPSASLEDVMELILALAEEGTPSGVEVGREEDGGPPSVPPPPVPSSTHALPSDPLNSSAAVYGGSYSDPMKMVLVVRTDLGMTAGKIAAQCVHAALGCVRGSDTIPLAIWEGSGEATVCLRCDSYAEMQALEAAAQQQGLVTYIVRDAGRTQIEAGSSTVLAIGPAVRSRIDVVTGHLKLHK
jgi:PTH2 family peptidyl-tRNA hydrolase